MILHRSQPYLIYLLCYPAAPMLQRHYIGITTPPRLHARMMEHARGLGCPRTLPRHQQRHAAHLARLWATANPALEQTLIRTYRLEALCPQCAVGRSHAVYAALPPSRSLSPSSLPPIYGVEARQSERASSRHRKRRNP